MTPAMRECLCTIYKGSRKNDLYLYVEHEENLETVPEELLERMGTLQEVMTIRITPDRKLARVKAASVLEHIGRQGYFLQLPAEENGGSFKGG